ncbi:MAG: hypothetical protein U0R79_07265 [Propionicimonas sp.]
MGADVGVPGHPLTPAHPPDADVELGEEQRDLVGRIGQRVGVGEAEVAAVEQHLPLRVADRPRAAGAELVEHAVVVQRHATVLSLVRGHHQVLAERQERPVPGECSGRLGDEQVEVEVRPPVATPVPAARGRAEHDQAGHSGRPAAAGQQRVAVFVQLHPTIMATPRMRFHGAVAIQWRKLTTM